MHARLQVSVCSGYDLRTPINIQTDTHRQHFNQPIWKAQPAKLKSTVQVNKSSTVIIVYSFITVKQQKSDNDIITWLVTSSVEGLYVVMPRVPTENIRLYLSLKNSLTDQHENNNCRETPNYLTMQKQPVWSRISTSQQIGADIGLQIMGGCRFVLPFSAHSSHLLLYLFSLPFIPIFPLPCPPNSSPFPSSSPSTLSGDSSQSSYRAWWSTLSSLVGRSAARPTSGLR